MGPIFLPRLVSRPPLALEVPLPSRQGSSTPGTAPDSMFVGVPEPYLEMAVSFVLTNELLFVSQNNNYPLRRKEK